MVMEKPAQRWWPGGLVGKKKAGAIAGSHGKQKVREEGGSQARLEKGEIRGAMPDVV